MDSLQASQDSEDDDDDCDGSKGPVEREHQGTQIAILLPWNTFHINLL